MATKQSKFYKGNAQTVFNSSHKAGSVVTVIATHFFTEALASTDILELIPVLPYGKITSFDITDSGDLGSTNLTIGLMSGTPGDTTSVRTSGAELISAAAAGTAIASTLAQIAAIPKNDGDAKSIGVKCSTTITAGAAKSLTVRYSYTA